jgi:GT2 family glycosyltransferase
VHVVLHCQHGGSDSRIRSIAAGYSARVIEYDGPFNFSRMNNLCAATVADPLLVFVNDDVVVDDDHWLDSLCSPFLRPEVGVVGAKLRYPDGTLQHSGIVLGLGEGIGHAGRYQLGSPFWPWLETTRNVSAVTGACMAVRRGLFEQLTGFDPCFSNNYNDVDFCLRAQNAGFEVVLNGDVGLIHREASTRARGTRLNERVALWTKWGHALDHGDCFFSPNLDSHVEAIHLGKQHEQD